MQIKDPAIITITTITTVSFVGIFLSMDHLEASELTVSISTAFLVSCIFYVGTTYIPERQKKRRVTESLLEKYRMFKLTCIDLFLIASNSQEYEYRENLLDHREFRRYFSERINVTQERWHLVATSIDDGNYVFEELVNELEHFLAELNYARSSVSLHRSEVEDFIVRMNRVIHTMRSSKPGSNDYKYFCRTLWSIFTRWNHSEGQREDDYIETMITRIKNA